MTGFLLTAGLPGMRVLSFTV